MGESSMVQEETMRTPPVRSPATGYALAIVTDVLAYYIRAWLSPTVGPMFPFFTFFIATLITAGYGGLGPGLFSAFLGYCIGAYFFLGKAGSIFPESPMEWIGAFSNIGVSVTVIVLLEANRRARRRAEAVAEMLGSKQAEVEAL